MNIRTKRKLKSAAVDTFQQITFFALATILLGTVWAIASALFLLGNTAIGMIAGSLAFIVFVFTVNFYNQIKL